MRIALFATCIADALFPDAPWDTVRVLERLGHEVVVPPAQGCCGQLHANSGHAADALDLVRAHVRAFADAEVIVAPSGSCAGVVRHQHAWLAERAGDAGLVAETRAVAARTHELSELLVDVLGVTDVGARFPHRVTWHASCHSMRVLGVGDRPLRLLRAVEDLELIDLPDVDQCCGFGGTFAVKNADTSAAMLADKLAAIASTGAEFVAAADVSCLMHVGGGLSRQRSGVRTIHLASVLAATEAAPAVARR